MTTFRGFPACECLAKWLPVYEKELIRRKVIKYNIDIYQLIGNAGASAGTHSTGGAYDIVQYGATAIYVARQMGADAAWARTPALGFSPAHQHGVLRGCPHNSAARYQIAAVDAGYDGTGSGGMGRRDYGPRPLSKRTWQQGIEWQKRVSAPNTNVAKAREFLEKAVKVTDGKRREAIRRALNILPKK